MSGAENENGELPPAVEYCVKEEIKCEQLDYNVAVQVKLEEAPEDTKFKGFLCAWRAVGGWSQN